MNWSGVHAWLATHSRACLVELRVRSVPRHAVGGEGLEIRYRVVTAASKRVTARGARGKSPQVRGVECVTLLMSDDKPARELQSVVCVEVDGGGWRLKP